jgi:hypothetical protein
MEFWDNFSKTVSDAADYTVKEAGKLTGIAKLKYKAAAARARLDTLYANMGKLKYEELRGAGLTDENAYNELTAKIDALKTEVEQYENEIAKLKNVRICVACRSVIGIDMAFCPRCGAKQPEPPKDDDNSGCGCGCGCDDSNCGCDDEKCDCGCDDNDCDCDCDDEKCDCDCDCDCDDDTCDCGCDCGCESDKTENTDSTDNSSTEQN